MTNKTKIMILILTLILLINTGCSNHSFLTKYEDNLYEITYNNYNDEELLKLRKEVKDEEKIVENLAETLTYTKSMLGSAFYTNNLFSRSYDDFNNNVYFIVRTNNKNAKYSSISINSSYDYNLKTLKNGLTESEYNKLPYLVLDGINSKGVFVSTLSVPEYTYINTDKKENTLGNQLIPRFVLDNAKSAKEAINLLKKKNIYNLDIFDINKYSLDFHYIIGDNKNTYVIEFINNEMVVTESNIVTNYKLGIKDNKDNIGIERYNLLDNIVNNKDNSNNKINDYYDTYKVLESIKYSNCYNTLNENFWFSEFIEKDKDTLFKSIVDETIDMNYKTRYASTFDIKNNTLSISLNEDYSTIYYFNY